MLGDSAGFPASSLATRCPECATVFRVVPDQLRLSEGWVRCGHCASVFDASENLVDLDQLPTEPTVGAISSSEFLQDSEDGSEAAHFSSLSEEDQGPVDVPSSADSAHVAIAPTPYRGRSVAARQILHGEIIAEPAIVEQASEPGESLLSDPGLTLPVPVREAKAEHGTQPMPDEARPAVNGSQDVNDLTMMRGAHPSVAVASLDDEEGEPHGPQGDLHDAVDNPQLSDVGFVRQADHRAFWKQPVAIAALVLGCCVLAVMLAMQVGTHQRDQVVAAIPSARAPLAALCRLFPCEPSPRHQIESVLIESSAFNRRGDHYLLSVDLRNSANLPLAMPALELTLTDLQDRIVVRRVLLPDAIGAPPQLDTNALWSGRFAIRVEDATGVPDAAPVAGYRLLAFYP